MSSLQAEIEAKLATALPDVEVLLAEVLGDTTVRLFIDHPDGVTLALCEQVTHALPEVRERYALEVSSPGGKRPLTKPDHFRRFLGRKARVRLRDADNSASSRAWMRRSGAMPFSTARAFMASTISRDMGYSSTRLDRRMAS